MIVFQSITDLKQPANQPLGEWWNIIKKHEQRFPQTVVEPRQTDNHFTTAIEIAQSLPCFLIFLWRLVAARQLLQIWSTQIYIVNHFCNRHFPVQLPRKMPIKNTHKKENTKLSETKALIGYELGRIAFALLSPSIFKATSWTPGETLNGGFGLQNDGLEKDGKGNCPF